MKNPDEVGGLAACFNPRLWLRLLTMFFALLSFSLMLQVEEVNDTTVDARDLFDNDGRLSVCVTAAGDLDGEFSFTEYQAIIAAGILTFVYTFTIVVFYLLPMGPDGKYCPLAWAFDIFTLLGEVLSPRINLVETILDGVFVVFLLIACSVGAATLEQAVAFEIDDVETVYFTLDTFVRTYSTDANECIDDESNPVPGIRASIALLFMSLLLLMLSMAISYNYYALSKAEV